MQKCVKYKYHLTTYTKLCMQKSIYETKLIERNVIDN